MISCGCAGFQDDPDLKESVGWMVSRALLVNQELDWKVVREKRVTPDLKVHPALQPLSENSKVAMRLCRDLQA